jgi:hypothetical protein
MRQTLIFIVTILLISCHSISDSFEKGYYEKISGIKFPDDYKVLETFDNGEWLTGTVLKIDNATLRNLVADNRFDTLQNSKDLHFLSNSYLNKYKAEFDGTKNIFYLSKSRDKNNWTYIADLKNNILWTEISYPDSGGK